MEEKIITPNTNKSKFLILMDSFKGSLTSLEAGLAVKSGLLKAGIIEENITVLPVADGGEGTVDAITYARNHNIYSKTNDICESIANPVATKSVSVTGPLGEKVNASYTYTSDGTAIIDMASCAGLSLVPEDKRNPLYTTTYGVGELILDAINSGCTHFIIGIGGSSTNDGGVGMLKALGFEFKDKYGKEIANGAIGLKDLNNIECENAFIGLRSCDFRIACDVTNPLLGEFGCSEVFAPQKGASKEDISNMDKWLSKYADITEHLSECDMSDIRYASKKVFEKTGALPNRSTPGTGAAGGLGYAFLMYLGGILESGISIVLDEIGANEISTDVDYIITGEGCLDSQTMMGKVISGICKMAENSDRAQVIIYAGSKGEGADACLSSPVVKEYHISTPENQPISLAMNKNQAIINLENSVYEVFNF